jgi:30S ribosomal protein S31
MGRGDKKTRKGKIARGSYGNSRPHKVASSVVATPAPKPKKEKVAKVVTEATDETPVVKKTKKTTKKTKEATTGEE